MASAMRKMAVYLGLVEDDHRYQEKYDSYEEYDEYAEHDDGLSRTTGARPGSPVQVGQEIGSLRRGAAYGHAYPDHRSRADHHTASAYLQ